MNYLKYIKKEIIKMNKIVKRLKKVANEFDRDIKNCKKEQAENVLQQVNRTLKGDFKSVSDGCKAIGMNLNFACRAAETEEEKAFYEEEKNKYEDLFNRANSCSDIDSQLDIIKEFISMVSE